MVVNGATQAVVPAPIVTVSNTPIVANDDGNFVASSARGVTTIGSITTNSAGSTVAVIGGTTSALGSSSSDDIGGAVATGVELSNEASRASTQGVILVALVCAVKALW